MKMELPFERRIKVKTLVILVLLSSMFWAGVPNVDAHNIDVVKAREKAREYARKKVDDPNRAYQHFSTDCMAAFPDHNHYVRCSILYLDDNRRLLCKEKIEVYLGEHHKAKGLDFGIVQPAELYLKHTSPKDC